MKIGYLLVLLAPALCTADEEHDHHHESCACAAAENGFSIDCAGNSALLLTTLAALVGDECSTDCSSAACKKNFFIIQSHHDHCLHDEVPPQVEDSFHDYEGVCEECAISRKRDPTLSNCPAAKCDNSGDVAFQALLTEGCSVGCSSSTCGSNYQILRTEHDNCEEDTISASAETGIHDLEEPCEVFNCNSMLSDVDVAAQLICTEEDHDDHDESAATIASGAAGLFVAFAAMM